MTSQPERQFRSSELGDIEDFFESSVVPMDLVDAQGKIVRVNQAEADLLEYGVGELVGRNIADLHADKEVIETIFARLEKGEKLVKVPARLRTKSGALKHVVISTCAHFRDGVLINTRCITVDVTAEHEADAARREAERLLAASHSELAKVVNESPFLLTRCGRDFRYKFVSASYARMIQRDPEEVIGSKIEDIVGKEGFETMLPYIYEVLRGQRVEYERKIRFKGVGERELNVIYTPDFDTAGEVQGWIASIRDVTEARNAQERLAADAAAMELLRDVGFACLREAADQESCLFQILDAAISITGADKGNVQLLDENDGALRIVAQRGFDRPFLDFFELAQAVDSACGAAMWAGSRIIVEDVSESPIFVGKPARGVMLAAEVRAVQSTPLISSSGTLLGMLSTHLRQPGRFSDRQLNFVDLLARQAADYLQRKQADRREERSKKEVRDSELRWRTMAEALPNLVWTDLPNGQCDWLSSQWGKFTGIPEHKLLGLNWLERVIHPDDRERTLATWQAACADKASYDLEYRIRRYDGEYHWFKTRGVPIRDDRGSIIYWFGTCTDIEDIKRAEKDRAHLAAIVQSTADAVYTYGFDGVIQSWNRGAEDLYGYSADEMIGQGIATVLPPDGRGEEFGSIIPAVQKGQSIAGFETLRMRRNGYVFKALLTASPIYNAAGKPSAVSIIVRDISEQKLMEEKLRESEATFRAMFSVSSVGKVQASPHSGRFLRVNAAMGELLGYAEHELLDLRFFDITHRDDWARDEKAFRRLVSGESSKFDVETRYVRKDGTLIWVRATINVIRSDDGAPLRTTAIIQDISDRKRAEEQTQLLLREVNHRSKNMLGIVQAIARQTACNDPNQFITHFGERIQALSASQNVLVESGWKDIPIDALVRAQLAHFRDLIDQRISLRGPIVKLTAAAAQTIGMALHELATNASKYGSLSTPAGSVEITWRITGGRFEMRWLEREGPSVVHPTRRGFGSTVLERLAKINLGAEVTLEFDPKGVLWQLSCPVEGVIEGADAPLERGAPLGPTS